MAFSIMSTAFKSGGSIPRAFTADGRDVSPALNWENAPSGTHAFAIICDDPDAPAGTWVHWVIWNLPGTAKGLAEGIQPKKTLADGSRAREERFWANRLRGPEPSAWKASQILLSIVCPHGETHHCCWRLEKGTGEGNGGQDSGPCRGVWYIRAMSRPHCHWTTLTVAFGATPGRKIK